MKKAMVFLVLTMMLLGSCFVQNTNTAQKIVGTWTDVEGYKWIFTADGKLKYDDDWYRCVVTNTEMTIFDVTNGTYAGTYNYSDQSFKVSFSLNGETIKLTGGKNLIGWSVAGPGWSTNQLTKSSSKSTNEVEKGLNENWLDKELKEENRDWWFEDDIITSNDGKNEFTNNSSKSTNNSSKSANKVDKKLNGTWVGEDDIITFNDGKFEVSSKEEIGTYTASNGKLSFIQDNDGIIFNDFKYSIKGKTLTLDFGGGVTRVFTRK